MYQDAMHGLVRRDCWGGLWFGSHVWAQPADGATKSRRAALKDATSGLDESVPVAPLERRRWVGGEEGNRDGLGWEE